MNNSNVLPFKQRRQQDRGTALGLILILCATGYLMWEMFR